MRPLRPLLIVLALASLLAVPATGHAATIKACKNKKTGALRITKKCRKNEKKVTWNTQGPKGDAGANGANGSNGTSGSPGAPGSPGQPQKVTKFSASQPGQDSTTEGKNTNVPLFSADGVSYSFHCQNAILLNIASLRASAPSGSVYSMGTLSRPTGVSRQDGDPWSTTELTSLTSTAQDIAQHSTLSAVNSNTTQQGVYTTVVEGPNATTFLHFKMIAAGPCTIAGVAYSIPNS